jgi:hypothetical protein
MKPAEWSKTEERSDDGISFGISIAPPKANVTFPTKSYWQSFVKRVGRSFYKSFSLLLLILQESFFILQNELFDSY